MSEAVAVSIVVCTLDRAPYLRRLLASLAHLDGDSFEVVVVNGPSADETEAVLEEWAGRIKVVRCPERNLSRARNLGVAAAAGTLVAFLDDDALPAHPGWLRTLTAALASRPDAVGVGGPVVTGDGEEREFDDGATSDYGVQAMTAAEVAATGDGGRWTRRVPGGNCLFRRAALLALGGFDETYTYYLDETDLCVRAARAGGVVLHEPGAPVRHYAARGALRRSFHDLDWRVIARSDTYFALRNGADPLPRRLLRTLALAPRKRFVRDIRRHRREGHYGAARLARYLGRWIAGVGGGLRRGLVGRRRTPLGPALPPPPPFIPLPRIAPTPRLRVGLVCRAWAPYARGNGIARYTEELAHALHALGHEVHVFVESRVPLRRLGLRLHVHGVTADLLPVSRLPETDRQLRWALAVALRIAALERAGLVLDVVESPNWESQGVAVRRGVDVPLVVRLHSPLAVVAATGGTERTPDDLAAALALERWLVAHADGVTSSTEGVLASVRAATGVEPARHARIPLGVPPPPDARPPAMPPRLLFVGRLERRKGIHTLLAVLPRLLARYPDLHADVVGEEVALDAPVRTRFDAEHARVPWRRRCRFHGFVDDDALATFYRDCTLLVAPSLYESFGLVYLEAMRHGRPVIGTRTGGIPEVVQDGETGLLVPPDDPDALHAAVVRLLDDPALGARLGARGRADVETRFSVALMAERTAAFYVEVIGAARR